MPVSFRITGAALERDQMCLEILRILRYHGWQECILASHSYGSVLSSHLLHHSQTSDLFGPILLIDPVSILLHLPDVAYNFTARKPKRANEHQLHCQLKAANYRHSANFVQDFASMDMGVAHTLGRWVSSWWQNTCRTALITISRRFFWSENILWKHDMDGRQVTVCLASRDLIVDTEAVGRYLTQESNERPTTEEWKHRKWSGKGLDLLWFENLDHAQVFDSRRNREILAQVVRQYSLLGRRGQSYSVARYKEWLEEAEEGG